MKLKNYFLAVIALILSGCSTSKDNTLPPQPLTSFQSTANVTRLWTVNVGGGADKYHLRLMPTIANNKIFLVNYRGDVVAVDASNGKILWNANIGKNVTTGIGVYQDNLFVGTHDGYVVALSQNNGTKLWSTSLNRQILASPVAAFGIVLVKTTDGKLTALSANDGYQKWSISNQSPTLTLYAASQPRIIGKLAIVGTVNGHLSAIDITSGATLWSTTIARPQGGSNIERMVDIDVNPVIVGNSVYIATYQGKIAAVNLSNGELKWSHKISSFSGIAADATKVYISDADSRVWAFNSKNGIVSWQQEKLSAEWLLVQ